MTDTNTQLFGLLVPHWPLLALAARDGRPFISTELFADLEYAKKIWGEESWTGHRLLTEYPPVMLPKRKSL